MAYEVDPDCSAEGQADRRHAWLYFAATIGYKTKYVTELPASIVFADTPSGARRCVDQQACCAR